MITETRWIIRSDLAKRWNVTLDHVELFAPPPIKLRGRLT
jgi:hypothetical protein